MNDDKFLKDMFERVNLPEPSVSKNIMDKIISRECNNTNYKELFIGISLSVFLIISTGTVTVKFFRAMDFFSGRPETITSSNTGSSTKSHNFNTRMSQLKAIMDDVNMNSERNDW
jgi:hypothetical protein